MARTLIPDALVMRRLKYDPETSEAERDRMAATLLEADRRSEAILLYEGRPEAPALLEILARAVADGSTFHVLSLRRMGVPVPDDTIRTCGAAAEAKGRWFDAHRAYAALNDEAALARVAEKLPGFRTAVPANKV